MRSMLIRAIFAVVAIFAAPDLVVLTGMGLDRLAAPAHAGGRGGHNTTFDPNSYGGGWTTITCDGTSADDTAYAAWRTAAAAANPALAKLRLISSPAAPCAITGGSTNSRLTDGIQNVIIWGYGASVSSAYIGGGGFPNADSATAFIHTANIGDASVSLVTAGQFTRFSVGDWVCVCSLSTQDFGFPPNFQYFEYRMVTASVSGTITLSSPLEYQHLETYPTMLCCDNVISVGPAKLFNMSAAWNTNYKILGLTIEDQGNQVGVLGRTVQLQDMVFKAHDGFAATAIDTGFITGTHTHLNEIDKNIGLLVLDHVYANQLQFQSSAINNLIISNSTGDGSVSIGGLGTSKNVTITNSRFPQFKPGAIYGGNNTLTIDGSYVKLLGGGNVPIIVNAMPTTEDFVYADGVFTIGNNALPNISVSYAWGIPGHKYYIGGTDGTAGNPLYTFVLTGITQDASNTYYTTGSWTNAGSSIATPAALPSPTFASRVISYAAGTIKQSNSQAGSDDFTQFAAPP